MNVPIGTTRYGRDLLVPPPLDPIVVAPTANHANLWISMNLERFTRRPHVVVQAWALRGIHNRPIVMVNPHLMESDMIHGVTCTFTEPRLLEEVTT